MSEPAASPVRNKKYNQPGQDARSYENCRNLMHKMARAGFARLQSVGVSVDYEDVFQTVNVAYVKALNGWNPDKGVLFSTYLTTACRNIMNRYADQLIQEKKAIGLVQLGSSLDEDDEHDMIESFASEDDTPEEWLMRKQEAERSVRELPSYEERRRQEIAGQKVEGLTPVARFMVEKLLNPPDELMAEFRAHVAHAQMARDMNIHARVPSGVTLGFIGRFYHLKPALVKEAKAELSEKFGVSLRASA